MKLDCDAKKKEVRFTVSPAIYGEDVLRLAAHVFERSAEAYAEKTRGGVEVTLSAKAKTDADGLEKLGREFLNELLNQRYRRIVGEANKELAALLVTQALFSARGGENRPAPAPLTPEQEKEAARLMAEAQAEIDRTMPKRIAPQGRPIPEA